MVEIDWYSYWHAMYAVMLSMVCVAIVSVIGIFGVVEVPSYSKKVYPDFKSYFNILCLILITYLRYLRIC